MVVHRSQITPRLPDGYWIGDVKIQFNATLILSGQAKDVFRFFYKSPADDVERYYRLQWIDEPVTERAETRANKVAVVTASAGNWRDFGSRAA